MAHNNWFFWSSLSPQPTTPSTSLSKDIVSSFDGIENLRLELLETADAMFGNGFVWLLKEKYTGNFRTLCTYNAGSPFPEAHHRRQPVDMATQSSLPLPPGTATATAIRGADGSALSRTTLADRLTHVQNRVGAAGDYSAHRVAHSPNALHGYPVLCVNVWQHMWLPDYGLLGRRQYLAAWWERIDWAVVEQRAVMIENEGRYFAATTAATTAANSGTGPATGASPGSGSGSSLARVLGRGLHAAASR